MTSKLRFCVYIDKKDSVHALTGWHDHCIILDAFATRFSCFRVFIVLAMFPSWFLLPWSSLCCNFLVLASWFGLAVGQNYRNEAEKIPIFSISISTASTGFLYQDCESRGHVEPWRRSCRCEGWWARRREETALYGNGPERFFELGGPRAPRKIFFEVVGILLHLHHSHWSFCQVRS